MKVCFFLGNIESHYVHALPLLRFVEAQFVTLSSKSANNLAQKGLNAICIDNRPDLHLKFDRKISATNKYIENNFDCVLFYEVFDFSRFSYIKKIPSFFLSHGNMLKDYMFRWRLWALRKYSYIAALSPYLRDKFIKEYKIPEHKLINAGVARNDSIFHFAKKHKSEIDVNSLFNDHTLPTIAYVPTWWGIATVDTIGIDMLNSFPSSYNLLIKLHPQTPKSIKEKYESIVAYKNNLYLANDMLLEDIFSLSDALIADLSSVTLEWILTDKPLSFIYSTKKNYLSQLRSIENLVHYTTNINEFNLTNLENILNHLIKNGIDKKLWNKVKSKAFYGYEGDSCKILISEISSRI